jgi:EmrB/QacA subfamily drug resistance transporter
MASMASQDTAAATRQGDNLAIAVATIGTVMLMLDISVVNTALNDIATDLDSGLSGLQWVVDAYTLPLAAIVLTAGSIADRFGRRRLFLQGMVAFTVASLLCGAAPSIEALVGARAIQGIGGAILFATALALISAATPTPEQRAKALAIFGAAIGGAFAIGPFVGGTLTDWFGWRAIFLINLPIGVITLLLATRIRESQDPNARKVDVPGQLALMGGLFFLVFALLRGNPDGWDSTKVVISLVLAGVLLLGFMAIEHLSTEPMLPLTLFRDPLFAGPQVIVFGIAGSIFAVYLYVTLYVQGVLGLSPIETGVAYLPTTFLVFIVSGATAALMTKFSPALLSVVGLVLIAGGLLLLPLTTEVDSEWTAILPGLLLAGVGMGLVNPTASALALEALPPEQSGLASGANDTFRQAGVAVGIAWLGTFVPHAGPYGPPQAQIDYVEGVHNAYVAAAIFVLVCAAVAGFLLLGRTPGPGALDEGEAEPEAAPEPV